MSDVQEWQRLMDETVDAAREEAFNPGVNQAPGGGTEGDDPLGLHYADLGPLAFVLNEAVDSSCVSGADRESLYEQIAQEAGEGVSVQDVEDVLTDNVQCPELPLVMAFSQVLSIDASIIIDASQKGGCTNLGVTPDVPPGY